MSEVYITTPVLRFVSGSLYVPRDKAYDGSPLVYKHGPDTGKPRVEFVIRLAFPKTRGQDGQVQHFAHTEFGGLLWRTVHQINPNAGHIPSFKWKVRDGDVAIVDQKTGRTMPIREGCAGHWIVKIAGGYPPALFNGINAPDPRNPPPFPQENGIFPGCFVEVHLKVKDNGAKGDQLGVYLNPAMVCLRAYGAPIVSGPDVATAGFGGAQLPPGASMTPIGAGLAVPPGGMPGQPPQAPGHAPSTPAAYAQPQAQQPPTMQPPHAAIMAAPQNPAFLQVPGAAPPNMLQPQPPMAQPVYQQQPPMAQPVYQQQPPMMQQPMAQPGYQQQPPMAQPGYQQQPPMAQPPRQMTPKAQGVPYEAWRQQSWTDEMLRAEGMMV